MKKRIKEGLKKVYARFFLNTLSKYSAADSKQARITKTNKLPSGNFAKNGPEYEKEEFPGIPETSVKPIAFYLPQFHPFEENDEFWGEGFTEWKNVSRAKPLFEGHYQPRIPGELGYYDLREKSVLQRQIELAKQYGIYGFCFHHYYLEHKTVMRKPLNLFLKNKDLDFPFCLHWANEPWTVRWDGEREKGGILLRQTHDEAENMGFIEDALPALRDERYIRIDGKPVLLIYRPALFPDFKNTAESWRKYCRENGLNGLYLVMVQTFFDKTKDPLKYNCDAAVEFPPHQGFCVPKKLGVPFHSGKFEGEIFDYQKLASFSMKKKKPSYTLFRGVMPGWDNSARTKNAKIYHGSSPAVYEKWLTGLGRYTKNTLPADRQFLFINAWNEWAEAAYLEPDRKYGYAFLNATARALTKIEAVK
ncbi:MAG: glycoside hydrolase family 99-like domain-containing protein [Bacteroidales bacterium]|nr:glycoside hydrolase family 99-like domain-containing protein [Bacteroidales bacterium]